MEKLLELENVSYSYQDGKEKNKILEHVSYSFEKGNICCCWCEWKWENNDPFPFIWFR